MTVLMFGWEFPPHISEGLGTACFGLTRALMEEKTKVLFVVPKSYGDEEIDLINASHIVIQGKGESGEILLVERGGVQQESRTIAIPSKLIPYSVGESDTEMKHWNWEFSTA